MAQRARGPAGGLSERYGLRGRRGPVIAAVVAAVCLAVVGALLLPGRGGGFEVTREEAGGAVTQQKAKGGREASKSEELGQDEGSSVPAAKAGEAKVAAVIVHVDGAVERRPCGGRGHHEDQPGGIAFRRTEGARSEAGRGDARGRGARCRRCGGRSHGGGGRCRWSGGGLRGLRHCGHQHRRRDGAAAPTRRWRGDGCGNRGYRASARRSSSGCGR